MASEEEKALLETGRQILLSQCMGNTIEFINQKTLDDMESNFDAGMRARLVDYSFNYPEDYMTLDFDLLGFEEHNTHYELPTYWDKNGNAILKWREYCSLLEPLPFKWLAP